MRLKEREELEQGLLAGNERIEEAIADFSKNRKPELAAKVFAAISAQMKDGKELFLASSERPGREKPELRMLKLENGQSYALAFTKRSESRRGGAEKDAEPQLLSLRYILNLVLENKTLAGLALNPFSENSFLLVREAIEAIFKQERTEKMEQLLSEENQEIEEAIQKFYQGQESLPEEKEAAESVRRALLQNVLDSLLRSLSRRAQVLVAVLRPSEGEEENEDGSRTLTLNHLRTGDGQDVLAIFTSGEEIRREGQNTQAVLMPLSDIMNSALQIAKSGKLDGIAMNAFGRSFLLNMQLIEWLLGESQRRALLAGRKLENRERGLGAIYGALLGGSLLLANGGTAPSEGEIGELKRVSAGGSLLLAELESLYEKRKLDYADIMDRFYEWGMHGKYTLTEDGSETEAVYTQAIMRNARGVEPVRCGESGEKGEGNESLARILPFSLLLCSPQHLFTENDRRMLHDASSLTNASPKAELACELYSLMIRNILGKNGGESLEEQLEAAVRDAALFYFFEEEEGLSEREKRENEEAMDAHREDVPGYDRLRGAFPAFSALLSIAELRALPEQELPKGRDAAESLILSVWALLNSGTYLETLSKLPAGEGGAALATIAGGLAGCCFGLSRLPEQGRLQIQLTADGKGLLGGFVRNWLGA